MDFKYIKENQNKILENKEDFINELEKMCNALEVPFSDKVGYKTINEFLLGILSGLIKYKNEATF
jgi:DNA-binding Xre family transcriptional regulator